MRLHGLFIIVGLFVVVGCDGRRIVDNGVVLDEQDLVCADDTDCVLVASACSCNSDGVVVAVTASAAERTAVALAAPFCNDVISDDPGCFASAAVCDAARCRLLIEGPSP